MLELDEISGVRAGWTKHEECERFLLGLDKRGGVRVVFTSIDFLRHTKAQLDKSHTVLRANKSLALFPFGPASLKTARTPCNSSSSRQDSSSPARRRLEDRGGIPPAHGAKRYPRRRFGLQRRVRRAARVAQRDSIPPMNDSIMPPLTAPTRSIPRYKASAVCSTWPSPAPSRPSSSQAAPGLRNFFPA